MKVPVAILGATGYVGQRLVSLLADHPYFEIVRLVASPKSAGQSYGQRMAGNWQLSDCELPAQLSAAKIYAPEPLEEALGPAKLVFSALAMEKDEILKLEEEIARSERIVLSNNSAHRWTPDVPLLIPEINAQQLEVLAAQKRRLGTQKGFIIAKPNCSIQAYVPALTPLLDCGLEEVFVATYQAVSGAGKRLSDWPEMQENMIPYIGGEEEKSESEPLKVWGQIKAGQIEKAKAPIISAHCCRVAVPEGHSAVVSFKLKQKLSQAEILDRWAAFNRDLPSLGLPNAPENFLSYYAEADRPQAKLDLRSEKGMGISIGRLREDPIFDYKFVCLSHNTLRGAAGGSVLSAELLYRLGYFEE